MDDIPKGNLNLQEPRDGTSSPDDDFDLLNRISNRMTSFSEFRAFVPEYDDEDDDDDSDQDFGLIGSYFSRRRTFSQCDSPVYPLPESRIYDYDAESEKEKGDNDNERSLKKFMVEYTAWSRTRRRVKSRTAPLRATDSDGELVNLSYCTDDIKMSWLHSGLFSKRSLSAPPGSAAAAAIEQKKGTHKRFDRRLKSRFKSKRTSGKDGHKASSSKTKSDSETTEASSEDVDKIESSVEKTSGIAYTEKNLGKTKSSSLDITESEISPASISVESNRKKPDESCSADDNASGSFTRTPESINKSDGLNKSNLGDSNESFSKEIKPKILLERESKSSSEYLKLPRVEMSSEESVSSTENTLTIDSSLDELSKSDTETSSTTETVSSAEYREMSWMKTVEMPHFPLKSTPSFESSRSRDSSGASYFPDDSKQKSPPEIASDPLVTEFGVVKVPTKRLLPFQKIPELSCLPGTSKESDIGFKVSTEVPESSEKNPDLYTSQRTSKDSFTERNLGEIESSIGSLVTESEMSPSSLSVEMHDSFSADSSKSESFRRESDSRYVSALEDSNESSAEANPNMPSEKESGGTDSSSELYLKVPSAGVHSEKLKSSQEISRIAEVGRSSSGSGGSLDELSNCATDNSSTPDTVGSTDFREMSWTTVVAIPHSPLKSTPGSEAKRSTNSSAASYFPDDNKQKSPPRITSDPPLSGSGVIKVPTRLSESPKMEPELSNSPGTSKDSNAVFKIPMSPDISPRLSSSPGTSGNTTSSSTSSSSSGSSQRPTDLNVKRRSAFYTFSPSSPTNFLFRPYSLPNFTRAPMKNATPRSNNLDGPEGRRVVRSLFMGNYWRGGYTPYSRTSTISDELKSVLRRRLERSGESSQGSSEERVSGGKPKRAPDSKSKVCKKLFNSPSTRETNETQTLQDHSSSELIGEVSNMNFYDVFHQPEDADTSKDSTPKRKETSPPLEELPNPSAKKIRSSEFEPEVICGKDATCETELEEKRTSPGKKTEDLLEPPSPTNLQISTPTSPKRKIADVEHGSQEVHPDDRSPESTVKRTKIKPPDDAVDKEKELSESEGENSG